MVFVAPWLLLALPALPLLWWLLRVTPPAPRTETFPAIRLLAGLRATVQTPARTPWWLLALRMLAAGLIVIGLARPVLNAGGTLPGAGPVLLAMDDDWSTAADWPARVQAAGVVLDRAERSGRKVALLGTSLSDAAGAPQATAPMPVGELRPLLAALRPKPWAADRAADAAALRAWRQANAGGTVAYVADGVRQDGDPAFVDALSGGPVVELRPDAPATRLLMLPRSEADQLVVRVAQVPRPRDSEVPVLAQTGDGRTLARTVVPIAAGAAQGEAALKLPSELRNQLSRLDLENTASAGGVVLLDERWRRRPVGLLAGDAAVADTPLSGSLFFLRRALQPYTELREGDLHALLARDISVIVLADQPLSAGENQDALAAWVRKGGLLIRFAGPRTAEATAGAETLGQQPGADQVGAGAIGGDGLLPVRLLAGERQLGGAMSWSQPAGLAAFPADSPFAGLALPPDVTVTRQVLAEPSARLAEQTWARLADGTPLVTQATRGAGRIVLFHTTANADWSNLALSGLFVDMLRRLVALSAGVATAADGTVLAPAELLDGFGQATTPDIAATGLAADAFATTPASPRHPPGLYGPENGRRALNLSAGVAPPTAAASVPGARAETLDAVARERALGPDLLAAALALLAIDLLLALRLRGFLSWWRRGRRHASGAAMVLLATLAALPAAHADTVPNPLPPDFPALVTRLAYVVTGDDAVDEVSRAGLAGLAEYVNRRTAANLGPPAPIRPGTDDLSFYPLIYWPIDPAATPPGHEATAALNDYMSHGGIILIDTRDGGSGAGMAPGADAALRTMTEGLVVPPLAPLTTDHVLARAFYLLDSFPGRYAGATVWVQRDQDRTNDSVSPVIIGGHDWAAAWAVDGSGHNPYATIPGGARQRTLAYRFGVNLVMYALTGNYKGDQVHVPAILERLGQ